MTNSEQHPSYCKQSKDAYYDQSLSEYFLDPESAVSAENNNQTIQDFFRSSFDILTQELQWERTSHYFIPLKMKSKMLLAVPAILLESTAGNQRRVIVCSNEENKE